VRSAGSKGLFDLVAIGPRDIILLQIKSNRPPSPAERKALSSFVAPDNARKEIWIFVDGERKGPKIVPVPNPDPETHEVTVQDFDLEGDQECPEGVEETFPDAHGARPCPLE
jgi:hypothetical protein